MALQYDNPVWTNDFTTALNANPGISDSTADAISALLDLENAQSVTIAGWDGIADEATLPEGQDADVLAIAVAGTDAVDLEVPGNAATAKVIIIESDADVTLTVGEEASATARVAAAVVPSDLIVVGGNGDDTLTINGSVNATVDGGDGNDTITTGAGNDVVIGGAGDDTIDTGAGNDTIITGQGNDTIAAGAGYDVIQVEGTKASFSASAEGDALVLTGLDVNADNSVTVTGAEFVTYTDGTLAVVETEVEASALRLYEGLLGRDADQVGAEYWSAQAAAGTSQTTIAETFLSGKEYQNHVNDSFVEGLYNSLLDRDADSEGEAAWLNALANGTSRADVVAAFAEGTEAQKVNLSNSEYVDALYDSALGRTAEAEGLTNWVAQLSAGVSRGDIADQIFGSTEAAHHANAEFVDSLYTNALGRPDTDTDAVGKAGWLAALDHGATQADVAVGIVGSQEAQDHATNVIVVHGAV